MTLRFGCLATLNFGLLLGGLLPAQLHAQSQRAVHQTHVAPVSTKPSALDKKQLEFYVRHLFVWPPQIEVQIGDPKPSPIPGFVQVSVHAAQGKAAQDELFYISSNGKQIIRGSVFDIASNPYKENLAKLKTEGRPSLGTPGAPVVLVEFSDFQCHFCKEEAKVFRDNLLKAYPKEVRLYFMDFPLDSMHPWAVAGAEAGQCVYRQKADAFWEYHDWIFEHQEETTVENLKDRVVEWAKTSEKDLDPQKLTGCMDSKAAAGAVAATVSLGKALEVTSTPTTFINGRPMVGATPWDDLKRVIDYEIGYQETAKNAGENCGCSLELRKVGVK